MKAANNGVRGSMGIPQDLQQAGERAREEAQRRREREESEHKPVDAPQPEAAAAAAPEAPPVTDEDAKKMQPDKILAELGIEFTDEMFSALLFKGFVELPVEIIKGKFKATFRTLTTEEHDFVDELVAAELKVHDMTTDGFQNRRALWVLAFGVPELQGRPTVKPVLDKDKKIDVIETAKKRREVLGKLSPAVINPMVQKHGAMTVAFNMIVSDPGTHIKNS